MYDNELISSSDTNICIHSDACGGSTNETDIKILAVAGNFVSYNKSTSCRSCFETFSVNVILRMSCGKNGFDK